MQEDEQKLNKVFKSTVIVHWAFTAFPVILALVLAFLGDREMFPHLIESTHVVVLSVLAAGSLVLLLMRERWAVKGARSSLTAGQSAPEAMAAAHLIRSTVSVTVAVLGLLGFMLTANMGMALVFVAVAFYALVRGRPDKDEWRRGISKGRR